MPPYAFRYKLKGTLAFINCEGGPFALSDRMRKENQYMLDDIKKITSGLQGEIQRDFIRELGDFEIGILKSAIEIQAKVHKLFNLLSLVSEAIDDNIRPLNEFLENINLSNINASAFEGLTVEDFTDVTEEELMAYFEPHITSKMHCKKVVREINKCRAKKDDIEGMIEEMRVTLVDIFKLSEKMTEDTPRIKENMCKAIKSMEDVKVNCQNDQNNHSWAKFMFASLCVVGAFASVCGGIFAFGIVKAAAAAGGVIAGAAAAVVGVGGVGAAGAGTAVAGYRAYQDHNKALEVSDYVEKLKETIKAMDKAQGLVQKRETQWLDLVLDPAKHAETDQDQLGKRVSKLTSAKEDKKRFQEDLRCSVENLQRFDEGLALLKESANAVLDVLHE